MKPFKTKSVREQKKDYIRNVRRSLTRKRLEIADCYTPVFERVFKIKCKVNKLLQKKVRLEDRIANKADKYYGGWDVWRHNPELLAIVAKQLEQVSFKHDQQINDLLEKMTKLLEPYNEEIKVAEYAADILIRTAK